MNDMSGGDNDDSSLPFAATVAMSIVAALALHSISSVILGTRRRTIEDGSAIEENIRALHNVPIAPGSVPMLGHALRYKADPPGFIEYACRHVISMMNSTHETKQSTTIASTITTTSNNKVNNDGKSDIPPVFTINLAGKEMVIVARDCPALRQIANSPESLCSARQAVADIGFEQTLGYNNVHVGTDVHKRIIKSVLFEGKSRWNQIEVPLFFNAIQYSFHEEIRLLQAKSSRGGANNYKVNAPDLFHFIRRIMLRVNMERMIGRQLVLEPNLLEEFMVFQDKLEDSTAQAAVLPRSIALVTCLWPVQRKRLAVQRRIAKVLEAHYYPNKWKNNESDIGFWLQEILVEGKLSAEEISEYIVGLLFAAHKNPAIGAAQAYLFLYERGTVQDQECCKEEANEICRIANKSPITATKLKETCPRIYQVCLETLRLTAHTIGGVRTVRDDVPLSNVDNTTKNDNGRGGDNCCPYYKIEKGQTIGLSHSSMNCDPATWGDRPLEFDTRRDPSLYDNDYAFTTFSHGVHRCPGQAFGVTMVVCTLIQLLTGGDCGHGGNDGDSIGGDDATGNASQAFNVVLDMKKVPPVSFERATLAQRAGPVPVVFEKKKDIVG